MNLETMRQAMPKYGNDIKINISNVLLGEETAISSSVRWAVALTCAYSIGQPKTTLAILSSARESGLDDAHIEAAKGAAASMAMNNVYYRFVHLANDSEISKLPARLRMQGLANHGIDKSTFELMALAASVINGCGMCIEAHVKEAKKNSMSVIAIQDVARIASVVNALAKAQSFVTESL